MNSIKDHYNERYRGVDEFSLPPEEQDTFSRRVGNALRELPVQPSRILDYGCGRGGAARQFCNAGHQVDAIDLSEEVIRLARQYEPRANYLAIDSEQTLPFDNELFDVVFSSEVIEHVFDIRAYLREIHRVLKPNGQLMLTTPYHGLIKNVVISLKGFERHFNPYHGHIRFFTVPSLKRCLEDHGFRMETFQGIGRMWPLYKSMYVSARRL